MKKNFSIALITFLVVSLSFVGCSKKEHGYQPNNQGQKIVVQEAVPNIGENLNLQSVGEIVKTSKNPQEMEERLNAKDGVNNLDLDGDGQTDFLTVTEYGEGNQHGYSICANLNDNSKPEVANIQVDATTREVTISGNQEYYGNNATYHSTFDATDFLLLAWMMQPHGFYHSPYYYGHYGSYYAPRPVVSYHAYNSRPVVSTRTTTYRSVPRQTTSKIQSPNANNKSAVATRTTNLSKPTQSQKSFKVNNNSGKPTQVNGFGNKTKNNTSNTQPSASKSKSSATKPASNKSYTPSRSSSPSRSSRSSSPSRSSSSRRR
jgi:hypothetical protein